MKSVKIVSQPNRDFEPEWVQKAWIGLVLPADLKNSTQNKENGFYAIRLEDAIMALSLPEKRRAKIWWQNWKESHPEESHIFFSVKICEDYN